MLNKSHELDIAIVSKDLPIVGNRSEGAEQTGQFKGQCFRCRVSHMVRDCMELL